jgi:hypothetical protein
MGKRSYFPRRQGDVYDTPESAVLPLLPYLPDHTLFAEPCAGAGKLIKHLEKHGHVCRLASDIKPRAKGIWTQAAGTLAKSEFEGVDMVITNPPWSRPDMLPIIEHFREIGIMAWLLIDANWMFTGQAAPYMAYCAQIVTIGRVKWIPGTTMTGKDDAAWFRMAPYPAQTVFHGKRIIQKKAKT